MKEISKPSPNHYKGRYGLKPDMLVCHQTGGTSVDDALKWYLNPAAQCSPNDVIDTNGDIYHLVDYDDAAYCNGTQTTKPNEKLYYKNATSKIVKSRKTNANFYTYSIEFVHNAKGDITEAQVQAAIWLLKNRIIPHAKSKGVDFPVNRDHIIGHCEIDPVGRSFCPGKNFPYDRIIAGVLAEDYDVKPCKAVYKSYGEAAIRTSCSKISGNIVGRCKKSTDEADVFYLIDGTVTIDKDKWLRHADGSGYSMYKDGLILFKKTGNYKEYKTTTRLNVRSEPKIDKKTVLGILEKGALIYITGKAENGWFPCIYKGGSAYVSADYVKEV